MSDLILLRLGPNMIEYFKTPTTKGLFRTILFLGLYAKNVVDNHKNRLRFWELEIYTWNWPIYKKQVTQVLILIPHYIFNCSLSLLSSGNNIIWFILIKIHRVWLKCQKWFYFGQQFVIEVGVIYYLII